MKLEFTYRQLKTMKRILTKEQKKQVLNCIGGMINRKEITKEDTTNIDVIKLFCLIKDECH